MDEGMDARDYQADGREAVRVRPGGESWACWEISRYLWFDLLSVVNLLCVLSVFCVLTINTSPLCSGQDLKVCKEICEYIVIFSVFNQLMFDLWHPCAWMLYSDETLPRIKSITLSKPTEIKVIPRVSLEVPQQMNSCQACDTEGFWLQPSNHGQVDWSD